MNYQKAMLFIALFTAGCASVSTERRVFLDSTTHTDSPPSWVNGTKVVWEEKDKVFVRATHTVRGNERVNGCFDLARLDSKETILSEIVNDVRGTLDTAQESISEDAELVLGKARTSEFKGRISGLRFSEQYYDRYLVGESERIDCHVLGEITQADHSRLKRELIHQIAATDPRIKEAISQKQIQFFGSDATSKSESSSNVH